MREGGLGSQASEAVAQLRVAWLGYRAQCSPAHCSARFAELFFAGTFVKLNDLCRTETLSSDLTILDKTNYYTQATRALL